MSDGQKRRPHYVTHEWANAFMLFGALMVGVFELGQHLWGPNLLAGMGAILSIVVFGAGGIMSIRRAGR